MKVKLGGKSYEFSATTIQRIIASTDAQTASKEIWECIKSSERVLVIELDQHRDTIRAKDKVIEGLQSKIKYLQAAVMEAEHRYDHDKGL